MRIILLVITLSVFSYLILSYFFKAKEGMSVQSIPSYTEDVPLQVFQTWSTRQLPDKMKETVEYNSMNNPDISFYLYDDKDCREYIKANFDNPVLEAYDKLKPGAYKADLWRYCILYQYGGAYLDIKFKCKSDFKLKSMMKGNFVVKDRPKYFKDGIGIYNAFMIFSKGHPFLLKAIQKTLDNVKNRKYGKSDLYVTGPGMLGELYNEHNEITPMVIMITRPYSNSKMEIVYDGDPILYEYDEYRTEMKEEYNKKENALIHYSVLWKNKDIYNK